MKNKVFFCTNCLNMSTRPRITFDDRGWCNACQWMEDKKSFNWEKRQKELELLLEKYRSRTGEFDCVVPGSEEALACNLDCMGELVPEDPEGCIDDKSMQRQAELSCEKGSRGSTCFTFAIKRRIVWKNGNPKVKIKNKDLKSPYVIAKKLQDAGFYDGDISQLSGIDMKTGKIDDTITITGEKKGSNTTSTSSDSTDIVEQLNSLKKLYLSGVLTEEEFNDAKNKLLSQ